MEHLIRDLRYAARALAKKPAFTAVAVLSLALGIGANTTIFSIVNEFFLKALPIEQPDRMVALYTVDEKIPGFSPLSHLNWRDLGDSVEAFSGVAGYAWTAMSVATGREPQYVFGQLVSGNYFDVLGVDAEHGRTFAPEEDSSPGTHPVAVASHGFWSRHLEADPDAVGRVLTINGQPFTLIGVAPRGFHGPDLGVEPELWVPMAMNRSILPEGGINWFDQRRGLFVFTLARMQPWVSLAEAQAELDLVSERLEREYPNENEGRRFVAKPLAEATINPGVRGGVVTSTALLMATVAVVLLIACANVANILLARATERRREIATRLALGASRGRLVMQLLTESVLVALAGGVLGLLVAYWARNALLGYLPTLPFPVTLTLGLELDARVLAFTFALAIATGLLFGLAPALQSTRPGLVAAIKDQADVDLGGGRRFGARNLLVVGQVALSLVALFGAGLFIRSLAEAQDTDPGYDVENLAVVSFDTGLQGYEPARGKEFLRRLLERVRALPGVRSASLSQAAPFQPTLARSVFLEGQGSEQDRTFVQVSVVEPAYFETMGIPIARGRAFTEADREDAVLAVIVNETMAEKFWPGADAVGQRFTFFGFERPVEVVGVVPDVKYVTLGEDPQPYVYQPLEQQYVSGLTLLARTASDPEALVQAIEREIRELDPDLPLVGSGTVSGLLRNALWAPQLGASLLTIFGVLALVLAAIGLYGVMSYAVNRRRREIGIRMALGAERGNVLRMVLRQGMGLALAGLAVGVLMALVLSRLVASLLFVSPTDPVALGATFAVLLAVALLASFFPARRATGVDPIRVLRYE